VVHEVFFVRLFSIIIPFVRGRVVMKATHTQGATPEERRAIYERLNASYRSRETELKDHWSKIGICSKMKGLDVACGSGEWMRALSRQFDDLELKGIDLAEDFLFWAEEETKRAGFRNITYHKCDIMNAADFGTFDFLHIGDLLAGLDNPGSIVDGLSKALRPGGLLIIEDIDIDFWRVDPPDPGWSNVIEAIQNRGKRHAASELVFVLSVRFFKDINMMMLISEARMDTPGMFSTLHTFLEAEEDQEWIRGVVRDLAENAAADNRFGSVCRVVISGRKP
jgi:2-polyprenyl-3-methyl-5-hydroxy-6-metoxy-1,4-benzoquinol methylase